MLFLGPSEAPSVSKPAVLASRTVTEGDVRIIYIYDANIGAKMNDEISANTKSSNRTANTKNSNRTGAI